MTALGTAGAARVLAALVAAALCGHPLLGVSATLNFVLNSNAIKNTPQMSGAAGHPGSAVSAAPGIPFEGVNKYHDKHQVRGVLRIGNAAIPNGSHLGKRAQNGLCKSSSRCVWQLPLGAVSGKVLERWAERDCEASRSAELGAQVPHPLPAPFPQPYPCAEDAECSADEYCASPTRGAGAQICQACRKLRKRCLRHAMCCPGNHCKNGICMPSDQNHFHRGEIEETIIESFGNEHSTLDGYSRRTTLSSRTYHTKAQEGTVCLRSSDCAAGLCCARHFWSKICKPVLKEGQVCTKHRRKGSHGLEIFQRCYCGEGLSCRMQKDHHQASNSSRLHTCQRH
uniref:Dickkopf N-terminal cysteine-rich domain-containing protein n=1 Tax=Capra hircus TaxID=9925 RepID=A0A8C2RI35_CAPHI